MIPVICRSLIALALVAPAVAQAEGAKIYSVSGTMGPLRIGAIMQVEPDHRTIGTARYFYATKLIDIPLRAGGDRDTVILQEPGGGIFRLRFVGNGSNKGAPLDFYNSVALQGSWSGGGRTYPVKLGLDGTRAVSAGRWYAQMETARSDAAFEATVRRFQHGATTGNVAETASVTHFPLRINSARPFTIATAAQLKAHWSGIFTPTYVAKLKVGIPHYMFVHNGQAMLGDGDAWFDDKGAVALNVGSDG